MTGPSSAGRSFSSQVRTFATQVLKIYIPFQPPVFPRRNIPYMFSEKSTKRFTASSPASMTIQAAKFTPEVLLSAPRRSAGVPNSTGELALFTVRAHSFSDFNLKIRCVIGRL